MRKFCETLSGIIASSGLNLNQISKVSGISNAGLTKLVKGGINNIYFELLMAPLENIAAMDHTGDSHLSIETLA